MDGQEIAPAFSALPTSLCGVFSMEAGAGAIEVQKVMAVTPRLSRAFYRFILEAL